MTTVYKLLIFYILMPTIAQGQHNIRGKVIDKLTSEPIPFAHIVLEGTQKGTTTNLYGQFNLILPEGISRSIQITCLGYKSSQVDLSSVKGTAVIKLEEDIITLKEVVVKPRTAENLLREAFTKIQVNYDTTGLALAGHYRMTSVIDSLTVRDIEANLDIYKPRLNTKQQYKELPRDSIYIREIRSPKSEIKDFKLKVMLDWENTPYLLGYRDFVREFGYKKNSFEGMLKRYDFEAEKMVLIEGRSTYVIAVVPKENKGKTYWNGKIFLDEETLAFTKIDVTSTKRMFKKLKSGFGYKLQSKINNVRYDEGEWKESVSYSLIDGKWYFNTVNSSKQFLISSKKRGLSRVPVNVTVEYATKDIIANNYTYDSTTYLPRRSEGYWKVERFMEAKYDSTFWNTYDRTDNEKEEELSVIHTEKNGYQFTKLDTLQGALTPLRTSYDVGFYHLDVEVFPKEEILKGNSLIRFKVVEPTNRIQIDLYSKMKIGKILYKGQELNFEREFNAVYIDFPNALAEGSIDEIKVFYSGRPVDYDPNIPMYASFLWLEDDDGGPWIQAICQGYGASGWWPNKDHLFDEPDSARISVTVPHDLDVISNGRLLSKKKDDNKTRFDWAVSYPINNYNITFNIGKYNITEDHYDNGTSKLDLEYHLLDENDTDVSVTTALVKPMLKTYEKYFGDYPFPDDGFKLVESPHPMEHQSCVAIGSDYFYEADYNGVWSEMPVDDINYSIVLHESAHEWWGNSVSCVDNAELWIHEAFATYAETLFVEDHYGYEAGQSYVNRMRSAVLNQLPILGKPDVNHVHYDIDDMYTKGALVLNTLRSVIDNDPLWFSILKSVQTDYKYQSITTIELIRYINKKTNQDLTYFFDQYLKTTQVPRLEILQEEDNGVSSLKYRWSNTLKGFKMPVSYELGDETLRLYPTTEWNKIDIDLESFMVKADQFYIELAGDVIAQ